MANDLRTFIHEVIVELRHDERMLALLRNSGLRVNGYAEAEVNKLVGEWIAQLGLDVSPRTKHRAQRFVAKHWNSILNRFRGNVSAAKMTLYNVLDARFHGTEGDDS